MNRKRFTLAVLVAVVTLITIAKRRALPLHQGSLSGVSEETHTTTSPHGSAQRSAVESGLIRLIDTQPEHPYARAFRFNSSAVVAVLLKPLRSLSDLVNSRGRRCHLVVPTGRSATAIGKITLVHGSNEAHAKKWDAVIVYCRFDNPSRYRRLISRVEEVAFDLGGIEEQTAAIVPVGSDRRLELTLCSPSIHSVPDRLRLRWLAEWLAYYKNNVSVEHFFLYTVTPFRRLRRKLLATVGASKIGAGKVSVMDLSSQMAYETHYYGQLITIYDCLFLNRQKQTKWTLFLDVDEVLWLKNKWQPLMKFLKKREKSFDVIVFDSLMVNITNCKQPEHDNMLNLRERMKLERTPTKGRQKYALKPTAVDVVNIHSAKPRERTRRKRVPYVDGHLEHYRGIFSQQNPICTAKVSIFE